VKRGCAVKRDIIKHIVGLGITEVSETETWIHYRSPSGLVFSARREEGEFKDLDPFLQMEGAPTTLPGGLAEAVDKAEIFSAENAENNVVIVQLKAGQMRLRGIGVNGWYEERKDVKWDGDPIAFSIPPKLLLDITTKTNDCFISPGRLKIDGGKFEYVTCLGKVD
jgi:hypothetical protein